MECQSLPKDVFFSAITTINVPTFNDNHKHNHNKIVNPCLSLMSESNHGIVQKKLTQKMT